MAQSVQIPEPALSKYLFGDTRFSWVWLVVRLYVGYEWFMAGWDKFHNPVWVGDKAGVAMKGFLMGALAKTSGPHPDVSDWYASFINHVAIPHAVGFSYLITFGEMLVGAALILGIFTGIAAFFGTFMNLNFLFAGTVSINPMLVVLQLFLILAWRSAGWLGLDHYVLPALGTPWQKGNVFRK
jgi:thiosulfate dehydrogenase (quinone) large subunit